MYHPIIGEPHVIVFRYPTVQLGLLKYKAPKNTPNLPHM